MIKIKNAVRPEGEPIRCLWEAVPEGWFFRLQYLGTGKRTVQYRLFQKFDGIMIEIECKEWSTGLLGSYRRGTKHTVYCKETAFDVY
jgi:hypothetical protein